MGNVVRPNFRDKAGSSSTVQVPSCGELHTIYGEVGHCRVALFIDERSSALPFLRVKLMRLDIDQIYSLAMLPASQDSYFEAHAIAAAVLQALRLVDYSTTKLSS